MRKETFEKLERLCRDYNPFTCMIDSYWQMVEAERKNAEIDKEFNNLMQEDLKGYHWGAPRCAVNRGARTENELKEWLWGLDIGIDGSGDEELDINLVEPDISTIPVAWLPEGYITK